MGRFNFTRRLACLSICLASAPASAQQPPDLTRFRAFVDPLIGTWHVQIRDLDEHGKLIWDGAQKREFEYTISNEFLQESALAHSKKLQRTEIMGMHLFSYDPKQNLLTQQGFWPGKAGTMFTAQVRLADDNKSATGTISMPQEVGFRNQRRLEIKWENDRQLSYRTYGKDSAGREFLNEELIYTQPS